MPINLLVLGGSNSSKSINKKLAIYASSFFENANKTVIDLNDFEMPIFSVDKELESGHPEKAKEFVSLIGQSDLLIISLAEHNGSYSTAFKNVLDWASRVNSKTFQGKAMLLMATSPGARGGKSVLEAALNRFPFHDANIAASFSLPEFNKNFVDKQGIIHKEIKTQFELVINDVKSKLSI